MLIYVSTVTEDKNVKYSTQNLVDAFALFSEPQDCCSLL